MNHPSMTTRGRVIAGLIGITIAFMLPKRVECGYSGAAGCGVIVDGVRCVPYEVEPWGFSLLEYVVRTDVGFAYESSDGCR